MVIIILDKKLKNNSDILIAAESLFSLIGVPYRITYNFEDKDIDKCPLLITYGNLKNHPGKNVLTIPNQNEDKTKLIRKILIKKTAEFTYALNFDILKLFSDLVLKNRNHLLNGYVVKSTESKDKFDNLFLMQAIKALSDYIIKLHLSQNFPLIQKCYWPEGKTFAGCLTHDVDAPFKYNLLGSLIEIKKSIKCLFNFDIKGFLKVQMGMLKYLISRQDPYFQFENWINLEGKLGFKSSFYFCSKRRHKLDPYYDIKKLKHVMETLSKKGFEVGLHGSYTSYTDKNKLLEEIQIIEKLSKKKILGGRQHFLNFSFPVTWTAQAGAGLQYDSTLGYNNNIGSKNGLYFPFNIQIKNKDSGLVEIPMIIMDGALFSLKIKNHWEITEEFFDRVRELNGLLTINWHDRVFHDEDFPGWGDAYIHILSYFKDNGAYVDTADNIAKWHTERESLDIYCKYENPKKVSFIFRSKKNIDKTYIYLHSNNNTKIHTSISHKIIKNPNRIIIKLFNIRKNIQYSLSVD